MSDVHPLYAYVRLAVIEMLENSGWPDGFHRLNEFKQTFIKTYGPALKQFDTGLTERRIDLSLSAVFDEMVENGVFAPLDGKLAGAYYKHNPDNLATFKKASLLESEIYQIASQVGTKRYFSDVFDVSRNNPHLDGPFSDEDFDLRTFDTGPNIIIPASDRLVTLGHNQQNELDVSTTELIAVLEKENSVDGNSETRSWMLGRLKAARELIRGGTLHVWLMQATVLNVLQELSTKYKDQAIGIAASLLLELLVKHLFGIS